MDGVKYHGFQWLILWSGVLGGLRSARELIDDFSRAGDDDSF